MLDSTARAERIDLSPSEAAFYAWDVAQKPVAVHLPLTLIDRLESEAVETFRSLSSRGSEIGGLLLGSAMPGSPAVVTVSDFELIPCDYGRGPLYRLSDIDLGRFERAMEKYGSGSGARVVGYFRSHTRKGLSLDAEDLAFFEPRFLEPHQVVLLIRPFATKVSTAGIFIRENGRLGGETSYREFPFRSSELAKARAGEKSGASPSPASSPSAQPASPAKPQARAQIVPIASRREITLPEPVVSAAIPPAPPVAAPVAAVHIETPAPVAPKPQPSALPVEKLPVEKPAVEKSVVEKPAVEKPAAEKPDRDKEKAPLSAARVVAPPAEDVALVIPAVEVEPPAPKKNKKLRLVVAAAIGMLVLVGGSLVVYPMLMKRVSAPAVVPQDNSPLALRVERTSGGMLLTWNRDLPVIQNASKVVLSISDGERHENIQLDPNQVRTGSILYPPITQDVSFQMEVTDGGQTKTTSASLRVLDPRPSPLLDAAAPPAKETPAPAKPATADPVAAAPEETKPVEESPVSHPATPLKPFNTASLAQRLRPASSTDLLEAPPVVRATPSTSVSLPGIVVNQSAVPAPPKPAATFAPTATSAANAALPTGGQLVQAKVISRVDPEYPKLARQAGASGLVELEATISVDGKVKNPRVVHGNAMLQKAAIDAVLQWRYKPATLNGKPVDSPVEIKLNFVSQGH